MFTTAHANQTRVEIHCCRGSEKRYEDNELLGTLVLDNIPPGDRGEAEIEVTFRVDPDCILHVRAKDLRSDQAVEAKLNVIGAPTGETISDEVHLPATPDDKKAAKKAAKEEKERAKQEKRAQKEREKAAKKAAKAAKKNKNNSEESE